MNKLISLIIAVACIFLCSCNSCQVIDAEKYRSYVCYDGRLTCLKVGLSSNSINVTNIDGSREETLKISYRKIRGESDEQFIYANVFRFLDGNYKAVMQNPDNYIDVWNEWTVEKIDVFYQSSYEPKKSKTARIPTKIVSSTQSADAIAELTEIVVSEKSSGKIEIPKGYISEDYRKDVEPHYYFYIRVHFNESDNIIWDARIEVYYSEELQDRIIVMDNTKAPSFYINKEWKEYVLDKNTALYSWLNEAIEQNPQPKKQ